MVCMVCVVCMCAWDGRIVARFNVTCVMITQFFEIAAQADCVRSPHPSIVSLCHCVFRVSPCLLAFRHSINDDVLEWYDAIDH
jgi:hypothetical protein